MAPASDPKRYETLAPRLPEGPIDLRALVPGEGPLDLDVGFGRGRSVIDRLETAPDVRVIGVERKAKLATWLAERLTKRKATRARVFATEIRELLDRGGPDGCLDRVFLHFPDPWWKKRHQRRRVLDETFLDGIARLLRAGGELYVQTDVEERAHAMRDAIAACTAFELAGEEGFVPENPFGARSNREVRAEADGLPVYRILARRR